MNRRVFLGALTTTPALAAAPSKDRELIGQLDREVIALKQKCGELERALGDCGTGDPGTLYSELVQVYSGGPVKVQRQGGAALVTLPGDLLFASGGTTLREESDFALDLLGTALKLHEQARVLVYGHTDGNPPGAALAKLYPTNWELSAAWGAAVARALSERFGVHPGRITAGGRAGAHPVAENDTPEGRATNRRVVVHILPSGTG